MIRFGCCTRPRGSWKLPLTSGTARRIGRYRNSTRRSGPFRSLSSSTRVLDLGCGYGTLAVCGALLGHEVVAVDWFVPNPPIGGIEWRQLNIQVP